MLPEHRQSNTTGNCVSQSSHPKEPHYSSFVHWSYPAYAPKTNPHRWPQQALNLAALPAPCAQPTLLYFVFGDSAKHIAEIAASDGSSSTDTSTAQERLVLFFRPYFSRLPNYSPSDPKCQPEGMLATSWSTDEYAGDGSYCNFQVGVEKADEHVETMRRGEPERGVWLAGEHTAPFVALGTVTGACWSGEGVVRRILEAHGVVSGGNT